MISVIIPTYYAQDYLEKLLFALSTQTLKDFELIIIDSSSTDKTVEIAQKYTSNVIIIPQSEFDHGGTRSKAGKIAKGEFLIYLTQDALPFDDFSLENALKVFANPNVSACYGRQIAYEDSSLFGTHLRLFNYGTQSYIRDKDDISTYGLKTAFLSDSFAVYRRSSLEAIGWFKDGLILGEDTYAGAKMVLDGFSIAYVADAKVYHSHSYSIMQEFKRYFDIGVFHAHEAWILQSFGKAEGEGMKYVKSEIKYLLAQKAWYKLPEFIVRNAMKYLGYKMGQKYKLFPLKVIKILSMHHRWWRT